MTEATIENANLKAEANEIILVAGKGHEDEQIYKVRLLKLQINKL